MRQVGSAQQRKYRFLRLGLTAEEYDAAVEACGGQCYICSVIPTDEKLVLDQGPDGTRGLLCRSCKLVISGRSGMRVGMEERDVTEIAASTSDPNIRRYTDYLLNPPGIQCH